jgi:replicative DNA helicase
MIDKLPPHAPDAEAAIIGCCLSFPLESVPHCQKVITSEDFFYDMRNRTVWNIINSNPIEHCNTVYVTEKLRSKEMLDSTYFDYLSSCQDKAIGPSFLEGWLQEVVEKHIGRQLITACSKIISLVMQGAPIGQTLDTAERDMLGIRTKRVETKSIKQLVSDALHKIEQRCERGDAITGLPTGLMDLDRQSDGMHPGEMIVIAGFPSTGKTALAVNIAVHNALLKVPCAIFTAEMRPVQLVVRSICAESRINFQKVAFNDVPKLVTHSSKLAKAPIHIEPASGLTIGQVVAEARRLKQKENIRLVVVDYIQLLQGRGDNREQEISSISKGLKAMALELDCAVLGLSQLNDDGKLRESRAISQDADTIWKLENDGDWQPSEQPIKLYVEKCRDGATGTVDLLFFKAFTRFVSVSKI